jgi:hypothetical protein
MVKCKGVKQKTMWAYFSPDGYLQFRSVAYTKKDARLLICDRHSEDITHIDYEKAGYILCKILVDVKIF